MPDDAIESLQELGLSLYESRLYLGLLIHGPQNGNELSRTSGVPSSKVYSTLDKLVASGMVHHVRRGGNAEYVCVSPTELVERLRLKYARPLEFLERTLPALVGGEPAPDILQIANLDAIIEHARAILRTASREVYISAWDETLNVLRDQLAEAEERGVKIFAMVYGELELEVGSWQHHSYQETVASRIGGHMMSIVVDGREALIAHIPERGRASGIQTQNPVVCLVAEEYLRHDLLLQMAKTMTGYEEWDKWLHTNADVRALTLGRTGRESSIEPAPVGTV